MICGTELDTGKGQDMVRYGSLETNIWWMVVADGHGHGKVINHLKSIRWEEIIQREHPMQYVIKSIERMNNTQEDGATISIVKVSETGAKCWWIGDSQIRIFKNGDSYWSSENHNYNNKNEMKRIQNNKVKITPSWGLHVLNDTDITMKQSCYFHHSENESIAMSRALGHNNQTYSVCDYELVRFDNANAVWRVIIASDGVWDMISNNDTALLSTSPLNDIVNKIVYRWNKDWSYKFEDYDESTQNIADQIDDIGIVMWENMI